MTPAERKAEFDRLFKSIPAKRNIDRIRFVTQVLFCEENTVRVWTMENPPRIIPASKLKILQRALAPQKEAAQ